MRCRKFLSRYERAIIGTAGSLVIAGFMALTFAKVMKINNTEPLLEDLRSGRVTVQCLTSKKSADALSKHVGRDVGKFAVTNIRVAVEQCKGEPDPNSCIAEAAPLEVSHALRKTATGFDKSNLRFTRFIQQTHSSWSTEDDAVMSVFGEQAIDGIDAMRKACKN
ncbi:hypothetical protein KKE92_00250 [Candidatus Micrarchaeota archaeon]|nr:hypothetical protein [Candidatus Micrarchaeota archaeon]MBU1682002.1 hypothetical protein [Candidatus Micrarchaeota archaeon]